MARQEGSKVRLQADRAHARSASAVRDAKRLVQVQMADVGAVIPRSRQADLGVEIGPIEINLATEGMHDVADRLDLRLEHAMRGRIRDHDRGKVVGMSLCL